MSTRQPSDTSNLSWNKKLVFSLVTTAAFFLLLELMLALLGVKTITSTSDPNAGFSKQIPLLATSINTDGDTVLVTAANKIIWFNPQSFMENKSADTKRVFCLGGSTTYGRPFSDSTSYVRWLRDLLPNVDPHADWEVFNAGGVSYASYRVTEVMRELAQYEPDLFIVYSAHNEFLERLTYARMFEPHSWTSELSAAAQRSRMGSLIRNIATQLGSGNTTPASKTTAADSDASQPFPDEVDELLNHSIGPLQYDRDAEWQKEVINEYRLRLLEMISIARSTGAEIVFVMPASNLRGTSPFKSLFDDGLDVQLLSEQVQLAEDQLRNNELDLALETIENVIKLSPRSAAAQYVLGKILFARQNWTAAELAFQRALDEDVCPLRAISRLRDVLRSVTDQANVPLVDFEQLLRTKSVAQNGHACLGDDYFLDHVHPTLDVHRELGMWIIDELLEQSIVKGRPPSISTIENVQQQIDESIDYQAQGQAFRNLAKVNHWSGKFSEAAIAAQRSLALTPNDLESRFLLADSLTNEQQYDAALKEYRNLFKYSDFPRAYLPYGELLLNRGLVEEAEPFLLAALITDNQEHLIRAYFDLGVLYSATERYELAVATLERVMVLTPDNPDTMNMQAYCLRQLKRETEAINLLQRVLALDSDNPQANHEMAKSCLAIKDIPRAKLHIEAALRADPDNPEFQATLLQVQQNEGRSS